MNTLTRFMLEFVASFARDERGSVPLLGTYVSGGPPIPPPDPGDRSVTIGVLAEQFVLSAPYQIVLEAQILNFGISAGATEADYDPQVHDVEYIWSIEKVGDPSYQTSLYSGVPDLPDAMRVRGTKYEKIVTLVFGKNDVTPGSTSTFRVAVTAIDLATGASVSSEPVERTIQHPDDVFTPAETFIVRGSGSTDTGWPTTSNPTTVGSIQTAREAAVAAGVSRYRICVERGYPVARMRSFGSGVAEVILMDTWGDGEKPTVGANNSGAFNLFGGLTALSRSVQIDGFKVVASNESRAFSASGPSGVMRDDLCVTVSDFDVDGVDIGMERVGGTSAGWLAFHNLLMTRYTYCGSLGLVDENCRGISFVGCNLGDDPARSSDNTKDDTGNAGGGGWSIRMGTPAYLFYQSSCYMYGRQGWFVNQAGISTLQPRMRISHLVAGVRHIADRCAFEGGNTVYTCGGDNGATKRITNTVISRCVFLAAHDTQRILSFNTCGTIRGCFLIYPPSTPASDLSAERFFQVTSETGGASPPNVPPVKIYNNTCIFLRIGIPPIDLLSGGSGFPIKEANNIFHQPYTIPPQVAGSFSLPDFLGSNYRGYKTTTDPEQDPHYVCEVGTVTTPFTVGEIVTGSVSGVSKVFAGFRSRFRDEDMLAFDMDVVTDKLDDVPGFQRFASNDVLTGSLGGGPATMSSMYSSQGHDTAMWATDFIPKTITPNLVVEYSGISGAFAVGGVLTNGTATATIGQIQDLGGGSGRLWCRQLPGQSGAFSNGDALTDDVTAVTATASQNQLPSGCGNMWTPLTSIPLEAGSWADFPFTRTDFLGNETDGQGAIAS